MYTQNTRSLQYDMILVRLRVMSFQTANDYIVFFSTLCAFRANNSFATINLIGRVADEQKHQTREPIKKLTLFWQ